jgi:Bacterial extracellular solute-binding proteins, family 5 Middle
MGRRVVAFGFIVCLQAMSLACSSHLSPAAPPVPSQPDQPPESPSPVPSTSKPMSAPATTLRDVEATDCALIAEGGEPVATVALSNPINPSNAPHPTNDSERLVFRQLYETLVRTDCHGRVSPGLAASWQLDANGRTWIVRLRENARFSDGMPVTAADVQASWTDGTGGELRPSVSGLVQSVVVVGDRDLAIILRSQRVDVPLALAHPDLAIAKSIAGSPWKAGTRSSRIATEGHASAATLATEITVDRDNLPALRFFIAAGDARDLLDQGVDLLLTRDPATVEYAATLPQFRSVPLAWQRTRILLAPGRSRSAALLSEDARHALADDAVRGEARGARGPFWWQETTDCEVTRSPQPDPSSLIPRIVYDGSDGAARDLAERFVGLSRASGPAATAFLNALLPDRPRRTYQRAIGLTGEALARTQRRGADAGYVTSVDSRSVDPCQDLRALMDRAPWLDPETIVPLVETRLQAIMRRGRSGVTAEWDGGLVIAPVNDSR